MDKQKAIEIIKDAPVDWGYYSELRNRFFIENRDNNFSYWYRSDAGKWKECIPLYETIESMIPKSEILKIAEGEEMKNAGDNLVLGCEDSKCDEWPKFGDKVTWGEREIVGILKCVDNGCAWILCPNGKHTQQGIKYLKPPKTPEEELRDDIVQLIDDADGLSSHVLALSLMSIYNITKKPQ